MSAQAPDGWLDHRLLLSHCRDCGRHEYYPRPFCTGCGSRAIDLAEASGRGTLYAFTLVQREVNPRFSPPYTLALVELEEGPRMLSHLINCPTADVRCGLAVRLVWRDDNGSHLPLYEPAIDPAARGDVA